MGKPIDGNFSERPLNHTAEFVPKDTEQPALKEEQVSGHLL